MGATALCYDWLPSGLHLTAADWYSLHTSSQFLSPVCCPLHIYTIQYLLNYKHFCNVHKQHPQHSYAPAFRINLVLIIHICLIFSYNWFIIKYFMVQIFFHLYMLETLPFLYLLSLFPFIPTSHYYMQNFFAFIMVTFC